MFKVVIERGSINRSPTVDPKYTPEPVSREEAESIRDTLVKKRLKSTYELSDTVKTLADTDTQLPDTATNQPTKMPVYPLHSYPHDYIQSDQYWMQRKYDGRFAQLHTIDQSVIATGKIGCRHAPLSLPANLLSKLPCDTIIDTEALSDHYRAFDIIRYNGNDLTGKPFPNDLHNFVCCTVLMTIRDST